MKNISNRYISGALFLSFLAIPFFGQFRDSKAQGFERDKIVPVCSNLGVEAGWGTWQGTVGTSNPLNFLNSPTAPSSPYFDLMSNAGVDSCTPGPNLGDPSIPFVAPGFGAASFRIGEPHIAGCKAEKLVSGDIIISGQDTNIMVAYAVVFSDGGHPNGEQPFVQFSFLDKSGSPIPLGTFKEVLSANSPGVYPSSCSGVYYKSWTTRCFNLYSYINGVLSLEIISSGCSAPDCSHFAYSYWDFACGSCAALTAIDKVRDISDFIVFPSVSSGIFQLSGSKQISNIEIYNLMGAKIYSNKINANNSKIDMGYKPDGVYILHIISDEGISIKKIAIAN